MKGILTGIVTHKKEDGKVSTNLWLTQIGFTQYETQADICKGFKTLEVYYPAEVNADPGDLIDVEYSPGFKGLAQVSNISVVKRKEK